MWKSCGSRQGKGSNLTGATIYYLVVHLVSIFSSTVVTVINRFGFKIPVHIFTLNVGLPVKPYKAI